MPTIEPANNMEDAVSNAVTWEATASRPFFLASAVGVRSLGLCLAHVIAATMNERTANVTTTVSAIQAEVGIEER